MSIDKLRRSFLTGTLKRFCALILMFAFVFPLVALAQENDDKKKKDDQKKQEKAAKAEENASKQQVKRERRYAKIRAFALERYQTEPDFKDEVDDLYRKDRRDQKQYAYEINMRLSNVSLADKGEKVRFSESLYDNPLAQDYVNRVGQSLVPRDSTKLYAFKIIQDPGPDAKALSIGTVYVTTGLLATIDNEAQLAYVLAHEIGHIEKDHWFEDALVIAGTPVYMEKKEKWTLFTRRFVAGLIEQSTQVAAASVMKVYDLQDTFQWEGVQEDEADMAAMKYMFDRNYDVREIQKFYERMKTLTADLRSQTGFFTDPQRIRDRLDIFNASALQFSKSGATVGAADLATNREKKLPITGMRGVARMLNETLAPEIRKKLDDGELIASSEEFQSVMSLVKRDNGISAFQHDMFKMARENLSDSIAIRSNDPLAYYYYGKVLKQTSRNPTDTATALANLDRAITEDKRQTLAEPYLFRAMLRLVDRNPNEARYIVDDLRVYVTIYQRENAGSLPPNMDVVYAFMQDLGVLDYRASPAMNTTNAPNAVTGSRPTVGETVNQPEPATTAAEKASSPGSAKTAAPRPAAAKKP